MKYARGGMTSLDYLMEIQRLENKLKKYDWISVNDRLPEIGEEVLITFSDGDLMVGELLPDGQGFANPYEYVNYKIVTHWMPLPELPESEGDAG